MAYVSNNCDIRLEAICNHFCSSETNLLLDAVDDVETDIEIFFVLFEESCNLCDHKSSCSIVHGSPYIVAIIEHHKLIFVGDDIAYFDAEFFDFFFGGASTI